MAERSHAFGKSYPYAPCDDVTGWFDSGGPTFNCAYYENEVNENACSFEGDLYENDGHTANSACCTCGGGGTYACSDVLGWVDSDGDNCSWYEMYQYESNKSSCSLYDSYAANGHSGSSACCACGGGEFTFTGACSANGQTCLAGTTCNDCCNEYTWWDYKVSQACGSEPCWSDGMVCGKDTTCSKCCNSAHNALGTQWQCGEGEITCSDVPGWYDAYGEEYDCTFYEVNDICSDDGSLFANLGHTANSACCACGGGEFTFTGA